MIRVLVYVVILFLLAAGFAWLAERPGDLFLTWQGYEIRTSLMVAAIGVVIIIAALALIVAILRAVIQTPRAVGNFFGARRRDRGYRALSRGMIAVGAGDVRAARRAADESRALLGEEPLALLLAAQAAQIAGDAAAARAAFETLSEKADTRVLGLHGLFIEARRQDEHAAARHFAEEAAEAAPRIPWAGSALFEYQCRAGDWDAALKTLAANADARIIDRARAQRLRAVLLTARAIELENGSPDEARGLAQEAHRLAPELVPAAVVASRLLTRYSDIRRASRVIEATWRLSPHPELAEAYASVRPGDSVRDRLKRVRQLAALRAHHAEGSLAVARAAIDAHEWQEARQALQGLASSQPSEGVCLLMADIEEGEHGDEGRVRAWLTRAVYAPRDPVWTADAQVFERWAPVSPISGRVDAFEWKVVAAQLRPPPVDLELEALTEPSPPASKAPTLEIEAAGKTDAAPADAEAAAATKTEAAKSREAEAAEAKTMKADVAKQPPVSPAGTKAAEPDETESAESEAEERHGEEPSPDKADRLMSRAPDDPGPQPPVDDEDKRRFRVF